MKKFNLTETDFEKILFSVFFLSIFFSGITTLLYVLHKSMHLFLFSALLNIDEILWAIFLILYAIGWVIYGSPIPEYRLHLTEFVFYSAFHKEERKTT